MGFVVIGGNQSQVEILAHLLLQLQYFSMQSIADIDFRLACVDAF